MPLPSIRTINPTANRPPHHPHTARYNLIAGMHSPPRQKMGGPAPYKPRIPSPLNPHKDQIPTAMCEPSPSGKESPKKEKSLAEVLLRAKAEEAHDAWQEHHASQNKYRLQELDWDEDETDTFPDQRDKELLKNVDLDTLLQMIDEITGELDGKLADGENDDCQHTEVSVAKPWLENALVNQHINTSQQRYRDAEDMERGDVQQQTQDQPGTQMSPTRDGCQHNIRTDPQTDVGGDTRCGSTAEDHVLPMEGLSPEGTSTETRLRPLVAHLEIPRPRKLLALAAAVGLAYFVFRFRIFDR